MIRTRLILWPFLLCILAYIMQFISEAVVAVLEVL